MKGGAHDGKLNQPGFQHFHQLKGVALVDGKANLRILLVEGGDAPAQQRGARGGHRPDVQGTGEAGCHRKHLLAGQLA